MFPSLSHPYQSLSEIVEDDVEENSKSTWLNASTPTKRNWPWLVLTLIVSITANLLFLLSWLQYQEHECSLYPQLTKTPAKEALAYKTMVFDHSLGEEPSLYEQEPSKAVDAAWRSLYEFSNSTLPGQDRRPSFNESLEFIKQKGNKIRLLDVFHQLHCLDTIRQAFSPEYYPHPIDSSHVMHCINSVRQSLMCMSDISVINWEWDEQLDILVESKGNTHTCRDFEMIKQWALEHHYDRQFVGVSL